MATEDQGWTPSDGKRSHGPFGPVS